MCDICASKLVDDINRKINWQPGRLIKWASHRGLHISRNQLEEHFARHLNGSKRGKKTRTGTGYSSKKPGHKTESPESKPADNIPAKAKESLSASVQQPSDDRFLSEVVSQVFGGLVSGAYELKLEHGFKAIELKQKISESINAEKLLLDLLNHIRSEELSKTGPT